MRHSVRTCMNGWLALLALLPLLAMSAEPDLRGVGDPTRPPPGVWAHQLGAATGSSPEEAASAAAAASAASAAAAEAEATARALTVTAIRIDLATGEGVAVVGEDVVKVGDKVRGMTVVAITHDAVQLKGPKESRRLVLPDVIESSRAAARAAKRGRKERK